MPAVKKRPNSKARLKKAFISAYPEPEQLEALRKLSAVTRVPVQVFLREGIDLVLKKHVK